MLLSRPSQIVALGTWLVNLATRSAKLLPQYNSTCAKIPPDRVFCGRAHKQSLGLNKVVWLYCAFATGIMAFQSAMRFVDKHIPPRNLLVQARPLRCFDSLAADCAGGNLPSIISRALRLAGSLAMSSSPFVAERA